MKKILLIIVAITFLTCSKNQKSGNLHITGNVKGLKDGKLFIQRIKDTALVVIDTVLIDEDSNFETHLDLKSPEMLYLFLDRGVTNSLDNNILFFAEPGDMTITTNLDAYISGAKISGSKNHDKYIEFNKIASRYKNMNLDLIEKRFYAIKNNNLARLDSINKAYDANLMRRYLFTTNFALNNKNLEVAPYLAISEIYDINIRFLDTIQKVMPPKVANSLYGKRLTDYVKQIKVNQTE